MAADMFEPVRETNIDRRKCRRVVPMRVLALGLSRTGTHSLRLALKQLGYNDTYHGRSAFAENTRDCEMWLDAVSAKFHGRGKPFGREEFDQLLGHCQAVADVPAAFFVEELIQAYPDAKVILTYRDVDKWHESVMQTIITPLFSPWTDLYIFVTRVFRSPKRLTGPLCRQLFRGYFGDFQTNGKRVYHDHYAKVQKLVPKDKLLLFRVEEGWGPLCAFLGDPVPDVPFQKSNDRAELTARVKQTKKREYIKAAQKTLWVTVAVGAIITAWLVH